jgi:hypothetical protein
LTDVCPHGAHDLGTKGQGTFDPRNSCEDDCLRTVTEHYFGFKMGSQFLDIRNVLNCIDWSRVQQPACSQFTQAKPFPNAWCPRNWKWQCFNFWDANYQPGPTSFFLALYPSSIEALLEALPILQREAATHKGELLMFHHIPRDCQRHLKVTVLVRRYIVIPNGRLLQWGLYDLAVQGLSWSFMGTHSNQRVQRYDMVPRERALHICFDFY